jgi:hypothetical protein
MPKVTSAGQYPITAGRSVPRGRAPRRDPGDMDHLAFPAGCASGTMMAPPPGPRVIGVEPDGVADTVVPGHGEPFAPSATTPR